MEKRSIFEWAQVKIAEEYLRILLKGDAPKQHVVSQLADAGGVNVIWEDNGSTKLEGSWEHIMKAQVNVFETYLRNITECNRGKVHTEMKPISVISVEKTSVLTKTASTINNTCVEENEVYVDITLSGTDTSESHKEPNSIMNHIEENTCNEDTILNDTTHTKMSPNISNYTINSREESILNKSKVKNCKRKECTYMSVCQHEKQYRICDVQLSNDRQTKDAMEPFPQLCFGTNQQDVINVDSMSPNKAIAQNKDSKNFSHLHNDKLQCEKRTEHLSLNHILKNDILEEKSTSEVSFCDSVHNVPARSKYLKKKDYEELAPFKFFCSLCSFKSKRESHFQRHMKLHNEVSELYKCSHCNFTSIRLSHLRRHELNHSNLTLTCNVCQYHTNNQKLLIRHKRIKHNAKKMSEVKTEILHCVHCEYQTSRYYFLQRHMRVHSSISDVQVYQCEECSYKTNRKEHFVRHTNNIHKEQRPFLCHRCGKAFKRQDALKQHYSIHSTQAAVSCSECGKGCRSQTHLSQHMSVHSSERSFLCELCGASFKTRAVQRKHMFTIHQHPKAFFCTQCTRKFSTKFALRRHIKQHSTMLSLEKRPKPQDQQSNTTIAPEDNNSMKLVAMDTIFFTESSRAHIPGQTVALTDSMPGGEKITLQLAETYETEAVHVIPAQTVMQPNNEATTVVYLAGTFTPL